MAEPNYRVEDLEKDPRFLGLPYADKVDIYRRMQMDDATAKQRAITLERSQPQGPSVMDVDPRQRPDLITRAVQGAYGLARGAGPSIVGGQVARHGGAFVPGMRALPAPAREATGSMLGEAISQLVDRTKPFDVKQIMMSGTIGGAAHLGGRLVPEATISVGAKPFRWIFRGRPGTSEAFQQVAAEELFEDIGRIAARTVDITPEGMTVDDLWNTAIRGRQVQVGIPNTQTAAQEIAAELALGDDMGFVKSGWRRQVEQWATGKTRSGEDPTLRQVDLTRRHLNELLQVHKDRRDVLRPQIKHVLRGIFTDIEDAANRGIPEAITLQQALAVSRRDLAEQSLIEYLDSPRALSKVGPGENVQYMNVQNVLQDLRNVQTQSGRIPRELSLLDVGLDQSEIDDLVQTLEYWNDYTSARAPTKGANVGSGQQLTTGAAAYALTGDPQVAAAMTMGRWVFMRSLSHPAGRRALRQLIRDGADVNIVDMGIQAMGQLSRAAAQQGYMTQIGEYMRGPGIQNPP